MQGIEYEHQCKDGGWGGAWWVMQGWGWSCRGRVGHAGVRWGGSCRGGVGHTGWGVSCRDGVG